eukprot:GHVO01039933.1.p1 GENE.GHVO01039933.1~~GHVO01039933.1.p1  ORF type:complete len:269 (+),score=31.29 GHVO01039933.1:290-1096(+)
MKSRQILQCLSSVDVETGAADSPVETMEIFEESVRSLKPYGFFPPLPRKQENAQPTKSVPKGAWNAKNNLTGISNTLTVRWKMAALQKEFHCIDPLTIEFALSQTGFVLSKSREMLHDLFPGEFVSTKPQPLMPLIQLPESDLNGAVCNMKDEFPTVAPREVESTCAEIFESNVGATIPEMIETCRLVLQERFGTSSLKKSVPKKVAVCSHELDVLVQSEGMRNLIRFERTPMACFDTRDVAANYRRGYLELLRMRNTLYRCLRGVCV